MIKSHVAMRTERLLTSINVNHSFLVSPRTKHQFHLFIQKASGKYTLNVFYRYQIFIRTCLLTEELKDTPFYVKKIDRCTDAPTSAEIVNRNTFYPCGNVKLTPCRYSGVKSHIFRCVIASLYDIKIMNSTFALSNGDEK